MVKNPPGGSAMTVVIASTVQIVEMGFKKLAPTLFRELGIFLPLITTNCAILGLAIFQTNRGYGFMEGIVFALGAGLGLTLALFLAELVHGRLPVPRLHGVRRNACVAIGNSESHDRGRAAHAREQIAGPFRYGYR